MFSYSRARPNPEDTPFTPSTLERALDANSFARHRIQQPSSPAQELNDNPSSHSFQSSILTTAYTNLTHIMSSYYDYAEPDCLIQYQNDRETFEAVLYGTTFAYLFVTVAFLPKQNREEQRRRCCSFLVPCLRAMTCCLEPCRPLLDNDTEKVIQAARAVGWGGSLAFFSVFFLLQLVPLSALAIGLYLYYPQCGCGEDYQEYCKCTLRIDFIPVGSCTGFAIFVTSIMSLMSLAFLGKAMKKLGIVRNATTYSNAGTDEEDWAVDTSEQELV